MSASDGQKTPEELRAEYEAIRRTNPVMAARFAIAHGVHELPRAADAVGGEAAPNMNDGRRRFEAMRPASTSTESPPVPPTLAELRSVYEAMRKTNPVAAARYAMANGLHNGGGK